MPTILTDIIIAAPPSTVRGIIMDFPSYPQWNPFITTATVSDPAAAPGTSIKVVIKGFINQNATIEQNNPGEFAWLSTIVGKWFFQADHKVKFEPIGDAGNGETVRCKVVQSEALSGFLSLLSFIYGPFMKKGFKKMNEALKVKAEAAGGN